MGKHEQVASQSGGSLLETLKRDLRRSYQREAEIMGASAVGIILPEGMGLSSAISALQEAQAGVEIQMERYDSEATAD